MKRREQKKKDDKEAKRSRMRKEFDSMSKELEVAGYAKGSSGQLRRVVPRKEAQIRSKKRKLLEQQDAQDYGILEDNEESRMRGSKAASEDHVIQGSRIFQNPPNAASEKDKSNYEDFAESEEDILDDDMGNEADDGDDDDGDYVDEEEKEDDDDSVKDDIKGDEEDEEKVPAENNDTEGADDKSDGAVPNSNAGDKTPSKKTKKYKKRMYRLRNFQSLRMAQQHGDALEAHARGQPKVAIEKLKQVARLAPSAPQIYSSLGMVYEDMLKESRKRSHRAYVSTPTKEAAPESEPDQTADDSVPDSILTEQLSLAEKAYGSYHIAALLCKKDFTLWVRAADSATVIAEIHRHSVTLLNLSAESRKNHKSEVKRWQSEALRDFKVADNLKPPGIDVPAKLASMQIEMGNLSEALTILTDLKNRKSNVEGARSEFQSSYKAWQLYSDLMLRIGHECIQWNRGIHKNDNYMFRRWLRKLSKVFDWQERRLQALSLALEAAAGTKSTEQFMVWMRQRAISRKNLDGDENADKDRWHLDTNEDELPHKEDKVAGNTAENSEHQENKEKDKSRDNIVRKESADGSPKDLKMSNEDSPIPPNDKDEGVTTIREEQFEADKLLLLDKNRSELEAFDKTTTEMSLGPESIAAKERETTRNILLESHKTAVAVLIGDYKKENFDKPAFGNTVTAVEGEEGMIEMHGESLPMSASCRQVCAIASELIKHLHGLELYTGARLVGEAVSLYLKDRAAKSDRRKVTQKRLEEWQEKVARSPFIFEPFDKVCMCSHSIDFSRRTTVI